MLKTYIYVFSINRHDAMAKTAQKRTKTINGHKIFRATQPDNRKVLSSVTNKYQVLFFHTSLFTPAVQCSCNLSLSVTSLVFRFSVTLTLDLLCLQ